MSQRRALIIAKRSLMTLALLTAGAALPLCADTITVNYTGVVSFGSTAGAPGDECFFGPCNISLTGDPFSLVFSFDTSLGFLDTPSLLYGGSDYGTSTDASATLTINGMSVTMAGTAWSIFSTGSGGSEQTVTTDGSENFISIQAASNLALFPTSLTTGYSYPVGTDYSSGEVIIGNAGNLSPTLAFLIDPGGGDNAGGDFVGPGSITVSDVSASPEPRTSVMMFFVITGFAAASLRRRIASGQSMSQRPIER
jgi:hypothetical protein